MNRVKKLTFIIIFALPLLFPAISSGQGNMDVEGRWSLTFMGGFDVEASGMCMKAERAWFSGGPHWWWKSYFKVFLLPGFIMLVVSLPLV